MAQIFTAEKSEAEVRRDKKSPAKNNLKIYLCETPYSFPLRLAAA
jgi:hypothetical protein